MRLLSQNRTLWLFTIYKKIPEILVGNFRSVRTVRVVYHLPKNFRIVAPPQTGCQLQHETGTKLKKLVNGRRVSIRNVPIAKMDYLFRISVCPGNFPVGGTKKSFTIYKQGSFLHEHARPLNKLYVHGGSPQGLPSSKWRVSKLAQRLFCSLVLANVLVI